MDFVILIVFRLIVLHTVDGRDIDLNPEQITSMREAHESDDPNRAFTKDVRCMINTSDGKYITVVEECEEIRRKIEEASK